MVYAGRYVFDKKHVGTHYAELVFLHQVRHADHVVHSGASGARNVDARFFMLGWARYGFRKKHAETRYFTVVFLHLVESTGHIVHFGAVGRETLTHYFSCSGGTV
jgi:hypothetical protein